MSERVARERGSARRILSRLSQPVLVRGSWYIPEGDKQCWEKRERKGCVEGLGEEGEGIEGRPRSSTP